MRHSMIVLMLLAGGALPSVQAQDKATFNTLEAAFAWSTPVLTTTESQGVAWAWRSLLGQDGLFAYAEGRYVASTQSVREDDRHVRTAYRDQRYRVQLGYRVEVSAQASVFAQGGAGRYAIELDVSDSAAGMVSFSTSDSHAVVGVGARYQWGQDVFLQGTVSYSRSFGSEGEEWGSYAASAHYRLSPGWSLLIGGERDEDENTFKLGTALHF